jgi:hypothetical protein
MGTRKDLAKLTFSPVEVAKVWSTTLREQSGQDQLEELPKCQQHIE